VINAEDGFEHHFISELLMSTSWM